MERNSKKLCGQAAGPDLTNPSEYRQLIGALMFLVNTRLDICFAVNTLSQYMIKPSHAHWIVAKHVLRYLHGTINLGLRYTAKDVRIHGKQKSGAFSMIEAEYIAASMASYEAVWMRKLFGELFEHVLDTIVIYCDNKSGIRIAENLVFHDKSKHIEIKYHYIQDMVQRVVA
eukprot:PITA_32288